MGGDSYIVGVRSVGGGREEAQAEPPAARAQDQTDEPSWEAFSTERSAPTTDTGRVEQMRPQSPPSGEEHLFVLHVATRDGRLIDGPDLHQALQDEKLKFGLNDIYHRITEVNGVPESVYSIANILKPGYLDPVEQDHLSTPGLALFLVLPGPWDGADALRDMLETADSLARRLDCDVLDDKRARLQPQTAQYMLDRAAEIDRQQRLQSRS